MPSNNVLNLDVQELRTINEGFSEIIIGHEDSGHADSDSAASLVSVGTNDSGTTPLFKDDITIYGGSITVIDSGLTEQILRSFTYLPLLIATH